MDFSPHILQDRWNIAALEHDNPALAQELGRCKIGKKAGRSSVHFCGLAWAKHDSAFVFLPRKSLVDDEIENIETARLTMRALARYGQDMTDRIGVASGTEGDTGLLAIITELAKDFVQYGIFSERMRHSARNSGKPLWARTVVRETAFLGPDGTVVYPNIQTVRSKDSHDSLLARVQASVLLEIVRQHGWWLDGLAGREEELAQYNPPSLPRTLWVRHLKLLLPELYAVRAISLATTLISYLENNRERRDGEFHFGVEDFHFVWEYMLRQVLIGVESGWNSRLPRPAYERRNGGFDVQDRGLQTDIVLRDDFGLRIVDAKYYEATTVANSPAIPDILKQFFYEIAVTSVASGEEVGGCFVFPSLPHEAGTFTRILMRHRDGSAVATFPQVECHYMSTSTVMRAFVEGRKLTLPVSL